MGLFGNKKPQPQPLPAAVPVPTTARPDFSDVQSGGTSTAPPPGIGGPGTGGTYTVVKGDSLSKIAKHHYGDADQWRRIYEANKDVIKDPDLIHPGQSLRIPR